LIAQYETVGYLIEVLAAELLFLHVYKKRSYFWLRLFSAALISNLIASRISLEAAEDPFSRFLVLLIIIAISVACMLFSFEGDAFSIFSSCVAGVATQHIANKLVAMIMLIPLIRDMCAINYGYRIFTEVVVLTLVYLATFVTLAREYVPEKSSIHLDAISIGIVLICIGVNRLVRTGDVEPSYVIATSVYAIICCIFALGIQFYLNKWQQEKTESLVVKELLSASEKQYEQWKAMVELNSIKVHDLKHMLHRIENYADKYHLDIPDLSPMRESIDGFSPLVKTGNEVIDVLLRNMDRLCRQQGVRLNCVSYTDTLGSFDSMSLYFLFANAIDNARAGAAPVSDKDKRLVDVSLKQFGDSVIIHVWNYFEGEITFSDELPVSNNSEEGHGYGLKSIKMIVDRFGGAMKAHTEGDVFHLNIILPLT
jgi:hypothetical protein